MAITPSPPSAWSPLDRARSSTSGAHQRSHMQQRHCTHQNVPAALGTRQVAPPAATRRFRHVQAGIWQGLAFLQAGVWHRLAFLQAEIWQGLGPAAALPCQLLCLRLPDITITHSCNTVGFACCLLPTGCCTATTSPAAAPQAASQMIPACFGHCCFRIGR